MIERVRRAIQPFYNERFGPAGPVGKLPDYPFDHSPVRSLTAHVGPTGAFEEGSGQWLPFPGVPDGREGTAASTQGPECSGHCGTGPADQYLPTVDVTLGLPSSGRVSPKPMPGKGQGKGSPVSSDGPGRQGV